MKKFFTPVLLVLWLFILIGMLLKSYEMAFTLHNELEPFVVSITYPYVSSLYFIILPVLYYKNIKNTYFFIFIILMSFFIRFFESFFINNFYYNFYYFLLLLCFLTPLSVYFFVKEEKKNTYLKLFSLQIVLTVCSSFLIYNYVSNKIENYQQKCLSKLINKEECKEKFYHDETFRKKLEKIS